VATKVTSVATKVTSVATNLGLRTMSLQVPIYIHIYIDRYNSNV
jgi:hypothetical protein